MSSFQSVSNATRSFYTCTAASSVITNTTTETAFDQVFTFPSQSQRYIAPVTFLQMKALGIMSTGLLNLGARVRVRWGGIAGSIILDTGALTLSASLGNQGWQLEAMLLITGSGASGQAEAQGQGALSSGLLSITALQMPSSTPIAVDFTQPNDIAVTWQWTTATANNSSQMRIGWAEIDGP